MEASSQKNKLLKPLTFQEYYYSISDFLIEKKIAKRTNIDHLLFLDSNAIPIFYTYKTEEKSYFKPIVDAIKLCLKGITYDKKFSLTDLASDLYSPKNSKLKSKSDMMTKQKKKEFKQLFFQFIDNGLLLETNDIFIYGIIESFFTQKTPFMFLPVHCEDKKQILSVILQNARQKNNSVTNIFDLWETVVENLLLNNWTNIAPVQGIYDIYHNKLDPSVSTNKIYSRTYILPSTFQQLPCIYIQTNCRPILQEANYPLILRSIFLHIFYKKCTSSQKFLSWQEKIPSATLSCLIRTDFVIDILSTTIANCNNQSHAVEILANYIWALEAISGQSMTLKSIMTSKNDLECILSSNNKNSLHFFNTQQSKSLIQAYLEEAMISLEHFLIIDNERFSVKKYEITAHDWLCLGIVEQNNNYIILGREAKFGHVITDLDNFYTNTHVLSQLTIHSDFLNCLLLLEGRSFIQTLTAILTHLNFINKYPLVENIIKEFQLLQTNENLLRSHFTNLDIVKSIVQNKSVPPCPKNYQSVTLYIFWTLIHEMLEILLPKSLIVQGKFFCPEEQYILKSGKEFFIFPDPNESIQNEMNKNNITFTNVSNIGLIITLFLNSTDAKLLSAILCAINPHLKTFISSLFIFMKTDKKVCFSLCQVIEDVLKLQNTSLHQADEDKTIFSLASELAQNDISNAKKNTSFILSLTQYSGFLFFQKKDKHLFFVDRTTLVPFGNNKLCQLDVLNTNQQNHYPNLDCFKQIDKLLQQLYWQNVIRCHQDKFKQNLNESLNYCLYSYGFDTLRLIEFGEHGCMEFLLKEIIEETELGKNASLSLFLEKMNSFKKMKVKQVSSRTTIYVENNQLIFIVSEEEEEHVLMDILLLFFITAAKKINIQFAIHRGADDIYKKILLVEHSPLFKHLLQLANFHDTLVFLQKHYGKFVYNSKESSKQTSYLLKLLNLWCHHHHNSFNITFLDILTTILNIGVSLFADSVDQPHMSLNYCSNAPVNNLLQCTIKSTISLNHAQESILFTDQNSFCDILKKKITN